MKIGLLWNCHTNNGFICAMAILWILLRAIFMDIVFNIDCCTGTGGNGRSTMGQIQ